jgi:formate hydrogenlyase subunit 3/multisubunit Na+/H+ antiporter MnhD subunit
MTNINSLENFYQSSLPLWIIIIPTISALIILKTKQKNLALIKSLTVSTTFVVLALTVSMYPFVIMNGLTIRWNLSFSFLKNGMFFKVDPLSLLFASISSLVWFAVSIYSTKYMEHEIKPARFYFFFLLTLSANLGIVLVGDLLSLFIFFEALGLLAYPLVIHNETEEAMRAGNKYLIMTIIGGLLLLSGIILFYNFTGTTALNPSLEKLSSLGDLKYIIAILMIAGFGVKAGMIPLHIWLPEAHPVAPSPASALLSGIMIKTGAYGIIRVVSNLFRPPFVEKTSRVTEALWKTTSSIGYMIIWIGIITMFLGVCMALLQENSKRMLAYHSISQMGYILMGIGAAAYLGKEGAFGFAGGIYHIINHALFKAALFLGVGAVYFRTGELNMYKLGGLRKKMPFTFIFTLIAALGISGIPLLNGFASKTLLHDAIIESYKHSHLISLKWAEIIFIITGGGTLCSFIKLIKFTFIDKPKDLEKYENIKDVPFPMKFGMGILAFFIVLLGFFPSLLTKTFINPSIKYWQLPTGHLEKFSFFSLQSFGGLLPSILIGISIFIIGVKYHLFHLHFPKWLSIDYWYTRAANSFISSTKVISYASEYLNRFMFAVFVDMWLPQSLIGGVLPSNNIMHKITNNISRGAKNAARIANKFDQKIIDDNVNKVAFAGKRMGHIAKFLDTKIIDNIVNGVGLSIKSLSRKLKLVQTGDVQSYGSLMILGAIILLIIILVFVLKIIL